MEYEALLIHPFYHNGRGYSKLRTGINNAGSMFRFAEAGGCHVDLEDGTTIFLPFSNVYVLFQRE
jgi:hypothetical protein